MGSESKGQIENARDREYAYFIEGYAVALTALNLTTCVYKLLIEKGIISRDEIRQQLEALIEKMSGMIDSFDLQGEPARGMAYDESVKYLSGFLESLNDPAS